ncbi:hypothetical protein CASFOL_010190 [Castilleja foliolosa]|uniref:F-box domain-containing protein n=1 Tax=Castilleja foliolosa TaxID=1961234 RepID=A0ABD3DVW1_9LAMI
MAGEGEIQFPKAVIQRLQSFLTGKEAARTAIVSKSWHSAWLTRPNIDFNDSYFRIGPTDTSIFDRFSKYAKKTIKRYEQSNLKIESFNLCMDIGQYGCGELAYKLIVKASRIGATRLCLRLSNNWKYVLPNEVFGADNLVELSVSGCKIDLDDRVVIKCRSLESLSLDDVDRITIDTISKIVSRCPSIEKFSSMSEIDQDYEYGQTAAARKVAANAMAVGVVDNLIPRLRCLVLGYESYKTLCLDDSLSRIPFLKDLTVYVTHYSTILEEGLQISNRSLERIKLTLPLHYYEDVKLRVKFDVPSVRNFTYEGAITPSLSFMSTPPSREWESHVSIKRQEDFFSTTWFNALSELLTELSQSKTHLSLHVARDMVFFDYKVRDKIIQGLRNHELENLTIHIKDLPFLTCYAFFDGLFRVCRPKLITQYYEDDPDQQQDNRPTIIDFICQTLEEGINFKVSRPTQFMYGLKDLEEVNAQACDMDSVPAVWKPIPFESLLDADAPDEHVQVVKQRIRLLLKWKSS